MTKWSDISGSNEDFELPKVDEIVGKDITITGVRFGTGRYGEYAIILRNDGNEYRTGSKVLYHQLQQAKEFLKGESDTIETKIEEQESEAGRTYYTLV